MGDTTQGSSASMEDVNICRSPGTDSQDFTSYENEKHNACDDTTHATPKAAYTYHDSTEKDNLVDAPAGSVRGEKKNSEAPVVQVWRINSNESTNIYSTGPFMPIGSKSTAWRDSLGVAFDERLRQDVSTVQHDAVPDREGDQSPRLRPVSDFAERDPDPQEPLFYPLDEPFPFALQSESPESDVEAICKSMPDINGLSVKELTKSIEGGKAKSFFITGATGFVGRILLASLLCVTSNNNLKSPYTFHCLVRCNNSAEGLERIQEALKKFRLWNPAFSGKIQVWPGDLELPRFGMSDEMFAELAETVDAIYLAGGISPSATPYSMRRKDPTSRIPSAYGVARLSEVLSFTTALKLASSHRRKRIFLISSLAQFAELYQGSDEEPKFQCASMKDLQRPVLISESTVQKPSELLKRLCPHRTILGGHAWSKWVVERLAQKANEKGYEVLTFRIPFAIYGTGDMDGMANPDHGHVFQSFLKSVIQEGVVPALKETFWSLLLTPIDVALLKMIYVSMIPKAAHNIFNLFNRETEVTSSEDFARWATIMGIHLDIASWEFFSEMVEGRGSRSPLYPIWEEFSILGRQWCLTTAEMGCSLKPLCNRITSSGAALSPCDYSQRTPSPQRFMKGGQDGSSSRHENNEFVIGTNGPIVLRFSDQFICHDLKTSSAQFLQVVRESNWSLTQNIQSVSPCSEAYGQQKELPANTDGLLTWPNPMLCIKALLLSMIHRDFFLDHSQACLKTVEDCLTYARYFTGLYDAGEFLHLSVEGWKRFFESIRNEVALSFAAQCAVSRSLVVYFCTLLYMTEMEKEHPEILETKIEAPIFILGFNRAGTTFLHHLLSEDTERFRSPRLCEMLFPYGENGDYRPVAMSNDTSFSFDPRIRPTQDLCNLQIGALMNEKFQTIHRRRSAFAEEDLVFFEIMGRSYSMCAGFVVPAFRNWLLDNEAEQMRIAYPFHKRIMQHLQFQRPAPFRWLLKMPFHLLSMKGIFETYPDAEIIFAHRNPVASVASWCGVENFLHKYFIRNHNPHLSGAYGLQTMKLMLNNFMAVQREKAVEFFCSLKTVQPPVSFVLNCYFDDLTSSPISEVRRIYKSLGWGDFSLETEQRFWDFLLENMKFRELMNVHQYDLAEVGLTRDQVEEALKDYILLYFEPEQRSRRKQEFSLARQWRVNGACGVKEMRNISPNTGKLESSTIQWPASLDQARRNFYDFYSFTKCMISRSTNHRVC